MAKSFLLETVRFYPSNRSLSYWKYLATIRHFFWPDPTFGKDGKKIRTFTS